MTVSFIKENTPLLIYSSLAVTCTFYCFSRHSVPTDIGWFLKKMYRSASNTNTNSVDTSQSIISPVQSFREALDNKVVMDKSFVEGLVAEIQKVSPDRGVDLSTVTSVTDNVKILNENIKKAQESIVDASQTALDSILKAKDSIAEADQSATQFVEQACQAKDSIAEVDQAATQFVEQACQTVELFNYLLSMKNKMLNWGALLDNSYYRNTSNPTNNVVSENNLDTLEIAGSNLFDHVDDHATDHATNHITYDVDDHLVNLASNLAELSVKTLEMAGYHPDAINAISQII